MIIREKFDSSSTGSFESGSNEVFERIVLSEIILAFLGCLIGVKREQIDIIESRSGFCIWRCTIVCFWLWNGWMMKVGFMI